MPAALNIIEKVIALEAVDLFQSLSAEQVSRIASIADELKVSPSHQILDPAKEVDSLYVILDGEAELSRDGKAIARAGRGEVLGSWALFDVEPLGVGATAITDVRLLRINRNDFYDLLSDNMQITQAIFSTLVRRFRKLAGN